MRYKKATYIANILFILLAIAFLVMVQLFPAPMVKLRIGAGYYPTLISVLLIIASVISIVSTYKSGEDRDIQLPNLRNAVVIVAVVVLFLVCWELTKMFYAVSFVAIGFLLWFLNPQPHSPLKLGKAVAGSLCAQAFIYVVFERLMYFHF